MWGGCTVLRVNLLRQIIEVAKKKIVPTEWKRNCINTHGGTLAPRGDAAAEALPKRGLFVKSKAVAVQRRRCRDAGPSAATRHMLGLRSSS